MRGRLTWWATGESTCTPDSGPHDTGRVLADEEYERVLSEARQRAAGGEDLDATIAFMRREGFWIIPCIKAVRTLRGVSLGEAKDLVHLSPAFADQREAHDAFHDVAEQSLELEDS